MNNTMNNKYTWKGAFITAVYVLAAVALFSLTGCVTFLPNISKADRAPLKGRAFYLASVTVSPDATPKGSIDEHCLPDSMYAAILKDQLDIAFKNAGLNEGQGPAVPVSIVITHRKFTNAVFLNGQLYGEMWVGKTIKQQLKLLSGGGVGYSDIGADWRRPERLMPTLALIITNGLKEIRNGKDFNSQPHQFNGSGVVHYWSSNLFNGYHNTVPKDGLHEPLTVADFERATGKTGAQLASICTARENAD